jgi:hypothetical protein
MLDFRREGGYHDHKVHKPKRDFSNLDGNDVHKCLYKCNQCFEMEEIDDSGKVKPISYVLLLSNGIKTT